MFTIIYRGCYIHGYCDKPQCTVSAYSIPYGKEFKSMRAAKLAIAKAVKAHDAAMLEFVKRDNAQ
jgi:hypothetical protein